MTCPRRVAVLAALAVCMVLISCGREKKLAPEGSQPVKKRSPELQAFLDAYKKIQVGMSEQEVDALLTGYSHSREDQPDPELVDALVTEYQRTMGGGKAPSAARGSGPEAQPGKTRPGHYIKTYDDKRDAVEGD